MDNRLVLGRVHIVEWLNKNDRQTGREVSEEIEPLGKVSDPPVEIAYHPIATASELLGLLHALREEYRQKRLTPLLHLETHGAKDGIEARGEAIDWRDLAAALVPLNRLTGLNLVVILAACEGFYGTAMLRPNFGQAPFRGLIGPYREVSDRELLRGIGRILRDYLQAAGRRQGHQSHERHRRSVARDVLACLRRDRFHARLSELSGDTRFSGRHCE